MSGSRKRSDGGRRKARRRGRSLRPQSPPAFPPTDRLPEKPAPQAEATAPAAVPELSAVPAGADAPQVSHTAHLTAAATAEGAQTCPTCGQRLHADSDASPSVSARVRDDADDAPDEDSVEPSRSRRRRFGKQAVPAAIRRDSDDQGSPLSRRRRAQRARALAQRKADSMPVVEALDGPRRVREVAGPLVDPAPSGGFREVLANRYVLKLLVSRELAKQYAASFLGLLWSYIQPGMKFVVFYFIFGVVMDIGKMPNYAIHLFCGFVIVHYFQEMWAGGTRSVWGNKGLVLKMRVPREIFPVAAMIVAIYHVFPQLLLLMVLVLVLGWNFSFAAIGALLMGLAVVMVFGWAMGLIFAALNVLFRDTANLVNTISMFLMFLTPSMYPFSMVHDLGSKHPVLYQLYMADPLVSATLLMQKALWEPMGGFSKGDEQVYFPDDLWLRAWCTLGACLVFLFLAQKFFARLESKFPERL